MPEFSTDKKTTPKYPWLLIQRAEAGSVVHCVHESEKCTSECLFWKGCRLRNEINLDFWNEV